MAFKINFSHAGALALVVALGAAAHAVQALPGGRTLAFALATGGVLGLVLQRTRFCFYCHARDWFEDGNPRGLLAIVLQAVVRLGRRALRNAAMFAIAAASFVAIFAFGVPFRLIVAAGARGRRLDARFGTGLGARLFSRSCGAETARGARRSRPCSAGSCSVRCLAPPSWREWWSCCSAWRW